MTSDRRALAIRDRGMTLPEVLIAVTMLGLIVAVLSSAVIVTLRQQDQTEGRFNVAQAEQSIDLWMPADLTSAHTVSTDPAASPCPPTGTTGCPGVGGLAAGSNALLVTWFVDTGSDGSGMLTNVSYHFAPADDGVTYELTRVECIAPGTRDESGVPVVSGGWSCSSLVVLRSLPNTADADGVPVPFVPGVTEPWWVIRVTNPLAPDAVGGADEWLGACSGQEKNACRVIVTIDGGGSGSGAAGGLNRVSITAGGTTREEIPATSTVGAPMFLAAKSRCGGPITLIVDESYSIQLVPDLGDQFPTVRNAVSQFVNALIGTPVQIQIVTFDGKSRVLGAPGQWHRYFDMTNPDDVAALQAAVPDIKAAGAGGGGNTNWEEALFRTFYKQTGEKLTASELPKTVVFFTDGIPTHGRYHSGSGNPNPNVDVVPESNSTNQWKYGNTASNRWGNPPGSGQYYQPAFNRAAYLADAIPGGTRLIGVGVGSFGASDVSPWKDAYNASAVQTPNQTILSRFITNNDNTVPETLEGDADSVNTETVDLYIPKDWSKLPDVMRTIALGQCAGTLTVQTRSLDGQYLDQPVGYVAEKVRDPNDVPGDQEGKYLETNFASTARTFDFAMPGGAYVDVELFPRDFSDKLPGLGYSTNHWSCSVAGEPMTVGTVTRTDSVWEGISLRVQANRAVSCTHWVNVP